MATRPFLIGSSPRRKPTVGQTRVVVPVAGEEAGAGAGNTDIPPEPAAHDAATDVAVVHPSLDSFDALLGACA